MRICLAFAIPLLMFIVSCEEQEEVIPEGLLSEEVFTSVMIDVQLAEGMKAQGVELISNSGEEIETYSTIFNKHDITKDEFQTTYSFYRNHPDRMEQIYEQVLDSLSKLDVEVKQRFSNERKNPSDTIEVSKGESEHSKKLNSLRE